MNNDAASLPAHETLRQLGGLGCLRALLGCKGAHHTDEGRGLCLSIMKGFHVKITIDADDTYSVRVMKVRGAKILKSIDLSGIYADGLHEVLERETGLAWRMPRVVGFNA